MGFVVAKKFKIGTKVYQGGAPMPDALEMKNLHQLVTTSHVLLVPDGEEENFAAAMKRGAHPRAVLKEYGPAYNHNAVGLALRRGHKLPEGAGKNSPAEVSHASEAAAPSDLVELPKPEPKEEPKEEATEEAPEQGRFSLSSDEPAPKKKRRRRKKKAVEE